MKDELNKSQDYLNLNNYEEAEKIYLKILNHNRNDLSALFGMGTVKIKTKNFIESASYFERYIYLSNDSIDVFINLSNIYILLKDYNKAILILEKARIFYSKNIILINNLSFVYLSINNLKLASDVSLYGLKLDQKNYFLINIQGNILLKYGDEKKAILKFKKSINIKNNFWAAYENLFNILEKTNKLDDLNLYLNKAKKNFNDLNYLGYYESLYQYRINYFENSKNLLLKINIKNIKKNNLIRYYDLLAKNYDKLGNFQAAYENFNRRNQLKINNEDTQKYDKKIILQTIKNYSKFFIKENLYKIKDLESQSNSEPIFLIGFPRSGTTLLDSILRSHSKIVVFEEKPIISNIRDKFYLTNNNLISSLNNLNKEEIKKIQKQYFKLAYDYNEKQNFNNKILIDKFPLNLMEIGFINKIFPRSKFILVLRHPCDVVLSCFVTDFKINEAMANFLELKDAVTLYDKIFSLWKQYTQELNINFHIIKYESLIYDSDKNIKELLDFLSLEWENNIRNFQDTAKSRNKINTPSYNQVIKPLYSNSINRWKNYEKIINLYPKLEKWIKEFNY